MAIWLLWMYANPFVPNSKNVVFAVVLQFSNASWLACWPPLTFLSSSVKIKVETKKKTKHFVHFLYARLNLIGLTAYSIWHIKPAARAIDISTCSHSRRGQVRPVRLEVALFSLSAAFTQHEELSASGKWHCDVPVLNWCDSAACSHQIARLQFSAQADWVKMD